MAIMRGTVVMTNPISCTDAEIDASLVEYVDLLFNLLGVDINYRRFQEMSDSERKQFIRNIKLKRLIDEE